jgi:hypothetical protein
MAPSQAPVPAEPVFTGLCPDPAKKAKWVAVWRLSASRSMHVPTHVGIGTGEHFAASKDKALASDAATQAPTWPTTFRLPR